VFFLTTGFGGWAALAQVSGAVIASGRVEADEVRQVVQHLTGGTVTEIMVREGDRVDAGAPLIALDSTRIEADLDLTQSQLADLLAESARLVAIRDGQTSPVFDPVVTENAAFRELAAAQTALLEASRDRDRREIAQLTYRLDQLAQATAGFRSQLMALDDQHAMLDEENAGQLNLQARGLTRSDQVLTLRRGRAALDGQRGQILANLAQVRTQESEISVQIQNVESSAREEALLRLREIGRAEPQLRARIGALRDALGDQTLRAPTAGIVHDLRVHALQSVVAGGATLMFIVPQNQPLHVVARVDPSDLGRINPSLAVVVQSASSRRNGPLSGTILSISPDTLTDELSGRQYYAVKIRLDDDRAEVVPGLPVEVFFETGSQTPFEILTYPLARFFDSALREG